MSDIDVLKNEITHIKDSQKETSKDIKSLAKTINERLLPVVEAQVTQLKSHQAQINEEKKIRLNQTTENRNSIIDEKEARQKRDWTLIGIGGMAITSFLGILAIIVQAAISLVFKSD